MKRGNQGDGGGRPPVVFSAEQTAQMRALASVLTKSQIADYFGISETTLRAIEDRQPEVSEAYKKGRSEAVLDIASNLMSQARDGNTTAAIFFLKTKAGWRETDAPQNQQPINLTVVNPHGDNQPN